MMALAALILAGAALYRLYKGSPPPTSGQGRTGEDPLETARRRYAAGEISAEEFGKMRKDLGS